VQYLKCTALCIKYLKAGVQVFIEVISEYDIFDIMLVLLPFLKLLIEIFDFINELHKLLFIGVPTCFQRE